MFQFEIIKDELEAGKPVCYRLAVRAVIHADGKILMVKTNRGDYKFPGGGVEEGETLGEALCREVREETGYADITVGPCIGTTFEQNVDIEDADAFFQMKSLYFVCRLNSDKKLPGEMDGYEKKLGFCGGFWEMEEVYQANAALLKEERKKLPEGMLVSIPWLEREVAVLGHLRDSVADQIALEVYECSRIIKEAVRSQADVDEKEGHANFVTAYDKRVQEELKKRLLALVPDAVFVGEEEDIHASISKGKAFIVDPIDGTTNFIKDYHCSCISVGMTKDGKQELGIVYNPYLEELFLAERGKGAFLNGERIRVSKQPLEKGIVLFGTSPYYEELAEKSFKMAYEYFKKAMDVRRSGSAAIDLCNIACGRAELYFELRLSPWDYAAGSLIVEEAGGKVTTVEGTPISLDEPCSVLALGCR